MVERLDRNLSTMKVLYLSASRHVQSKIEQIG